MVGSVLRIRYEILSLLSQGPIFETYAGRDRVQGREVSIRVVKPPFSTESAFIAKLSDVVRRVSGLSHTGVEPLYEVDEDESTPFVVGELSKGTSLGERIKKLAPFSVPVSVSTAISLCEGLSAIHLAGLVHGDVSAANIIALPDGQVRLQMAGVWEAYSASNLAGAMLLPLMAPYLAPEISAGGMPSPTSDVYSVGIVLYELLTGRLPFNADTPVAMAIKHATEPIPSVRLFNPSVPSVLDEMVKKALSKEPAGRYKNASDLLSDLRMLQDALRFGRSLTWPIKRDVPLEAARVAPKMSAVRVEPPPDAVPRRERESRDVPIWMMVATGILGAAVITLIGVFVIFNLNRPKLVSVPKLRGMSEMEARQMLDSLHLKLRKGVDVVSDDFPANSVIDEIPPAGDKVREGSLVTVRLNAGSRFVEVPSVKGVTADTARQMLDKVGLTLSDRLEERRDRDIEAGMIISQNPDARAKVARGTSVRVTVSTGRFGDRHPATTTAVNPADEKPFLYNLVIRLTDLKEPTTLRVDLTDDRGTRTVYEQRHQPGERIEIPAEGYGKQVFFRIFYDGEMVKQVDKKAEEATPAP